MLRTPAPAPLPPSSRAAAQELLPLFDEAQLRNDLPATVNIFKFLRCVMDVVQAVLRVRVPCRMQALIDIFGDGSEQVSLGVSDRGAAGCHSKVMDTFLVPRGLPHHLLPLQVAQVLAAARIAIDRHVAQHLVGAGQHLVERQSLGRRGCRRRWSRRSLRIAGAAAGAL